jgi:hypothetical protein
VNLRLRDDEVLWNCAMDGVVVDAGKLPGELPVAAAHAPHPAKVTPTPEAT